MNSDQDNDKYSYTLQWLDECRFQRDDYRLLLHRMTLAMQGKPWKNLYQQELDSNIKAIKDTMISEQCKRECLKVPAGQDFTLMKAVNTRANQMASGVDTYQYTLNDPYGICEPDTHDLLSAMCEQDYYANKLGIFASTFSRDLTTSGLTAVEVRYNPATDKNEVVRIHPKNIYFDTRYTSTGEERFRGYNMMISWKKLKKMLEDDPNEEINLDIKAPDRSILNDEKDQVNKYAKYSKRKIRSLNGLDIYVESLNKLASSPELARDAESYEEFRHDLFSCYNTNWYQSLASTPEARTKSNYNGDDVELTVLYDLGKQRVYKIINRRFVISMNKKAFTRKIVFPITNPVT